MKQLSVELAVTSTRKQMEHVTADAMQNSKINEGQRP